ncbi:SRPBCC family protein [candidate division KSB1 bacterium]|nr:SRPBCC family protein [candidate division KSB1 bacterium]
MKILKIIGIVLLVLIALFVVLGIVAPKHYSVERDTVIAAPQELVFKHIQYWRNWSGWSPWAERDSAMVVTIEGADGQEGALYQWVGDTKITGSGVMVNTGVVSNERLDFHLKFIEPYTSESEGYLLVEKAGGDSSRVTWGMKGTYGFAESVMMLFMNMDKMLGPDFDHGLMLLKEKAETEKAAIEKYGQMIQKINFPERTYAVVRKTVSLDNMQSFFANAFATLTQTIEKNRVRIMGAPSALYFSWDKSAWNSDVAAAIPVNRSFKAEGIEMISLPRRTAYKIDYYGPYSESGPAYSALEDHLKQQGLEFKEPVVEEYLTDPSTEPDSSKWLTRITYFAQ